jgi:hypothetical protein
MYITSYYIILHHIPSINPKNNKRVIARNSIADCRVIQNEYVSRIRLRDIGGSTKPDKEK